MKIEIYERIAFISEYEEDSWQETIKTGHELCTRENVENVVLVPMQSPETETVEKERLERSRALTELDAADVVIIGGGVTGAAIARELGRYNCSTLLLEKCSDIAEGCTKGNNGMIHSGYDPKHGTLKAKMNVLGNALYDQWAAELGFTFKRTGSFVCGFTDEDRAAIERCYDNGIKNQVPGLSILSGNEARAIEPALSKNVTLALWTPTAGYVEPYEVTLALLENAVDNGVRFRLDCEVIGFDFAQSGSSICAVVTTQGVIKCSHVINAAGLFADDIARFAGDQFYSIHPRRGTLAIFDKQTPTPLKTFAGYAPGPYTKGGGPMMTPDGTMLWGPSALEIMDKDDLSVDAEGLRFVLEKGASLLEGVTADNVITYFAGNRAATFNEDFIIQNSRKLNNFTHVAGIQSPGLASAPAIARETLSLLLQTHSFTPKQNFIPTRERTIPFRDLPNEHRKGEKIICRCEMVTEREIVEAVRGKIPARTLDAVKRRTRAGMGRCQSGFCGSKVLEIIARELSLDPLHVTMKGPGSEILLQRTR